MISKLKFTFHRLYYQRFCTTKVHSEPDIMTLMRRDAAYLVISVEAFMREAAVSNF